MTVWEVTNQWANDVAWVGPPPWTEFAPDLTAAVWKPFEAVVDGNPLHWTDRPKLVVLPEEGRKKRKPRADVSPFTAPGPGLIINQKARNALGDFLVRFGQLLEVDVGGDVEYYYNVTNVIECMDHGRSEVSAGYVDIPVFREEQLPNGPALFIDPAITSRIFVNDAAKSELDSRIAASKIVGMSFKAWRSPG